MWRFFKDFMVYGLAGILGKIAAIFLMPIYTNTLTKEEYGAWALIFSVQGLIGMVSNLEIHTGITRDYYEDGVDRVQLVSTGFFSILALSLTIMCMTLITRGFWCESVLGLDHCFLPAFTVMLIDVPAGSLMSFFAILTRYKRKPLHYTIGSVLQIVIQITISVVGIVVVHKGIISIFMGVLAGELFALCYFAFLNREHIRFRYNKEMLHRAMVFAIPILPAVLAGWLDNSMGQILVAKYVSVEDLGVYSIALSLASVFTLISTAFRNVWNPFLYENYKAPDFLNNIRRLFSILTLGLGMITLLLSNFSREIVLLLSNEGYLDACKYLTLLCIPMSFYLLFPFAASGVSVTRDTKYIGIAYVTGSCCNLILLVVTIRFFGVLAVPLCLAVSRILSYFIMYKASEKKAGYILPNYLLMIVVIIASVGYSIICFGLSLWIRMMISLVTITAMICYVFRKYDVEKFLSLLHIKNVK